MDPTIFMTTLGQMGYLFIFLCIGFVLAKLRRIPENTATVLSRLENYIFIPALVMGTFMTNFTVDRLVSAAPLLLASSIVALIAIALSLVAVRFCAKDAYIRKIYLYGLSFSNFGFMGNAIVSRLFPAIFPEYVLFTLVLWVLIYVWGVPSLLLDGGEEKSTLLHRLRSFVNPMFICMLIGMGIGLVGIPVPAFVTSAVVTAGDCMSPVAMLLTGMTVAALPMKQTLSRPSIYAVTGLRLVVYPLLFIAAVMLIPMSDTLRICALCSLAMPLGLNTIVIPKAYGKNTDVASGMALVSHTLSVLTIPLIFLIFSLVV